MLELAENKNFSCTLSDTGRVLDCAFKTVGMGIYKRQWISYLDMAEMRQLTNYQCFCRSNIAENAHFAASLLHRFEQQVDEMTDIRGVIFM